MLTLSTRKVQWNLPDEKRPEHYHHGRLREAIMETSLDLIAENGVRALTLREIGARLAVSRTAPYRHFADKATLLAALAKVGFARFGDVLEEARNQAGTSHLKQLEAMGVAYVRFAAGHRAHFEVMFGSGSDSLPLDAEGSQVADRAFGILRETIRDGQLAGEIVDGDPVDIARMVWSLVHGISLLGFGPGPDGVANDGFVPFSLALLQSGLRKRPD
jgi:AcrR family transcriptional regulator